MAALLKYWPIIGFCLNLVVVWICWSLRALAKTEVAKLVDEAEGRLSAKDVAMDERLDIHHDRLLTAEQKIADMRDDIGNLPTKEDIARLEGEVKGVGSQVTAANDGIKRIEGFFLAKGVERA